MVTIVEMAVEAFVVVIVEAFVEVFVHLSRL